MTCFSRGMILLFFLLDHNLSFDLILGYKWALPENVFYGYADYVLHGVYDTIKNVKSFEECIEQCGIAKNLIYHNSGIL